MIKAICTDFGGILFPIQPYEEKPQPEEFRRIKQLVIDIYNNNEKAIIDRKYTVNQFEADLYSVRGNFSEKQLDRILKSIVEINSPLLYLYKELSQSVKISALVNEAPKWTELRVYFHNLQNLFSNIYISAYIGHKKPEKVAYQVMLEKEQLQPNEVLFIDDSEENIHAAKELGIYTIKYESFDTTKEVLLKLINI